MKVLVADDDRHSLRLLEITLSKEGYEVITAKNGFEALDILDDDGSPDLVILDWMMPDLDGLSVTRKIRSMAAERYKYIVLVTARAQKEDIISGMDAGADDYIVKPFNAQELKVRLRAGQRVLELHNKILERNRTLQDFVYAVSHDLRTPLIALNMTIAQTMEGTYGPMPDNYRKILQKSSRSVQDLLNITETLLLVARYENQDVSKQESIIDLNQLAHQCIEELEPVYSARKISAHIKQPDFSPTISGERLSMRRLIINLLDNSSKFAPADSVVEIRFEKNSGQVSMTVSDQGPGVSPEVLPNLFQRFPKEKNPKRTPGTGLGLFLCRRIMEEHGGKIDYEHKNGSHFKLTFFA